MYAAPLFITLGARGSDQTPFERAKEYLGNAEKLVARARESAASERSELAKEGLGELTAAKAAIKKATSAEQKSLKEPLAKMTKQIDDLLDEG